MGMNAYIRYRAVHEHLLPPRPCFFPAVLVVEDDALPVFLDVVRLIVEQSSL
jgi:hypothetical protein